jgi:iron complex outermembrane receptor protein
MTIRASHLTLLAVAITTALSTATAQAQQGPSANTNELGEIVVTARQREEKITDVPVSVQAFSADDIKAAGIERPQDFINLTAGVSAVQTAEIGDIQISIRGINTGRDAETNFAFVVDGVLQTNPSALNQELNGVSQIEILKGPQGALYGRNAVAGAMILSTRKPSDKFEADIAVGLGDYGTKKADFWVGGPISDGVKGSLSAYTRKTNGQWSNSRLGCNDCVDYFDEKGVTGRLLFDAAGGSFDVKAKASKVSGGAINFNASLALSEAAAFYGAVFQEDPNAHEFAYLNNIKPENEQKNANFSIKGEWDTSLGKVTSYVAYNDQKNYLLTDGTSAAFYLYSVTPSCGATNSAASSGPLPAPFYYSFNGPFVNSFLPPYSGTTCDGYQYQQRDQKDTSFELRIASPGNQPLRWTAGIYYGDIKRHVVVSQGYDPGAGGSFSAQAFVPYSNGTTNSTDLEYNDDFHSKVSAVFGQLAYDIAPNIEMALALRYDDEKRSVDNLVGTGTNALAQTPLFGAAWTGGHQPYINPAYTQDPALATTGIPSRSKSYSQLQPKLSVNWKLSDDFSTYASYGYGFRSGGFNSTGSAATVAQWYGNLCLGPSQFLTPPAVSAAGLYPASCSAPGAVHSLSGVADDYKAELSKSAEIGFKSFLDGRRISLNAALFQTKVENMQFFNFFAGPFGLLRAVTNLDAVTIKGAEVDARWKANRYISMFAGYSLIDSRIDQYAGRPYTAGNAVPYAPKYTANAGIDLNVPFVGGTVLVARLDGNALGKTWFHPVQDNTVPNLFGEFAGYGQGNFSKQYRDAYAIVNARLGIQGAQWGVTAWSHNIGDKNYLAEIIPAPEFGGSFIHNAPGRSFGVDVSYKFGN